MEQKRLFVGNLPLLADEKDIEKKFSKFGNVVSTEIKQRFDAENEVISKFAFVTLEAKRSNFDACMHTLSSTTWKGHNLKLEFAKESFLNRLKRERDENLQNKVTSEDTTSEFKRNHNVKESPKSRQDKQVVETQLNGYNSDSSDEVKGGLLKFQGTKSLHLEEENHPKRNKTHSINSDNQELVAMKRFEDFSDVWKDSFVVQQSKNESVDLGHEHSFSHDNLKRTKNKEECHKLNKEKITHSKWFTKATHKQVGGSDSNLHESSSEDDYTTLKNKSLSVKINKLDDMEIVSTNYLEHNFNKNTKFENKWHINKNITDQSNPHNGKAFQNHTNSPRKTIENSKHSYENYNEHLTNIKHENRNCPSEILKSNFDKIAEEKRKKAFEEKRHLFNQQKSAIKMALAGIDTKDKPNKKIVFSDNEDTNSKEENNEHNNSSTSSNVLGPKKKMLFDEESDDETSFEISQQFEGVKSQKLIELQSRYAHDQRFTLDSRFYESDERNPAAETSLPKNEKEKQFEILEQIIGYQVRRPESKKKNSLEQVNNNTMLLRFDPTREDHNQFIVTSKKTEEKIDIKEQKKKNKERKEKLNDAKEEETVKVSKETFYKVNDRLKDSLQTKDDSGFSLRKLFNSKEIDELDQDATEENVEYASLPPKRLRQSNPFRYDSSDSENEEETFEPVPSNNPINQPTLMQPFFFLTNDPRFEELKEFFKNREIINEEDFDKKRKDLKRLIHHRQMNKKQKNRPFKTKLGGAKKRTNNNRTFVSKGWNQRRRFQSRPYK